MSTTTLDPAVAVKLRQFGSRRLRLLVTRGVCAGIVTFLLCIAVVALIDWYWLLTDRIRWALSGAAYLVTGGTIWLTCVRKLLSAPASEELAAQVEAAQPELRENLLSAVELATDDPAAVHDSPVFRGLLQRRVAEQMAGVRIARLLPLKLLSKWLIAALVVVVVLGALLSLPDPRFRLLAVRAMLPGANIERISRIKVQIIEPTPHSLTMAKDETVAIVADVTGGDFGDVILETITPDGTSTQLMHGRSESEFAANVHVTADSLQYRILAGDAVTRRYSITGKPRPQVTAFHKTFHFPDYSGLDDQTATEDHGDLLVLEGTQAELLLELDQDVSLAELRLDVSGSDDVTTLPLQKQGDGRWSVTVPVDEPSIYKVHLVSAETGFENLFSPRYEIRPLPDLIPRVGFVDQQETNLLLPPNDILALRGQADDDLPLVKIEQEVSVNGQDWVAYPVDPWLPVHQDETVQNEETVPDTFGHAAADRATWDANKTAVSANALAAEWDWDLLPFRLQTGDQVLTRLVATDRRGNRGESVPLRIIVSAPDFDPERHTLMQKKAALYDDFAMLANIGKEHHDTAKDIIERLRQESEGKLEQVRRVEDRALDRTNLSDLASKMREASGGLLQKIQTVTVSMPAGADAYDLDLAGQVMARLHHEHTFAVDALLKQMSHAADDKQIRKDLDELKRTFDRIRDDSQSAAHHFQHLISHNVMAAVASDFDALLKQQQLVAESPTQTWVRLLRQETVVLQQLEVVERLMQDQQSRLPDHMRNYLKQLVDWSAQRRQQLDEATESEDHLPQLQQLAQTLHRELRDRQRIDVMDGGLSERLNQARRDFQNRAGTLSEPLGRVAESVQDENRATMEASQAADSTRAREFSEQAARHAAEIDIKLRNSMDQLRSRRSLTQSRQDPDPQFAADAGLTSRATLAVLNQHRSDNPADTQVRDAFREIAPAYRILEAGHDLQNVQICLTRLIQSERWSSQDLSGRLDHPRQWDVIQKGLEEAINAMRRAGVDPQLMSKLDQIRWAPSLQQAHRKITQRRWSRDDMVAAGRDLVELRDALQAVDAEFQPVMVEARAVIAKYAPTIPEMAEQLAKQVRELEEQTVDAAEASPSPVIAELQQQQDHINQQLDDLFEALVEDANQQDLLKDEERERSRDADDSIAMVREPAKQMNTALDQAERAAADQQAKELAQAAEAQEKTAQALDKVAAHFDRLDKNMDVAESRAELRQFEREQGLARQMDQKFEPSQQLAEMVQQNPKDLLRRLEQELQNNPAMQEALSEISQNAVQEAQTALQDAAAREQEIQRANERSDDEFQAKKKELANNLKELGRDAQKLARQLVAQANSAASQAKAPEAQQKFAETQQQLNEAANTANSANEHELQADLAKKLQQTQDLLKNATQALNIAKDQSTKAKPEDIHGDDKNRQNAKKSLEDQRKRFMDQLKREADGETRRLQGVERSADQQVKSAQNALKQMDSQVKQAEKILKQKPEDQGRRNALAQAEQRRLQAEDKVAAMKERHQQAQQQTQDARRQRDALNKVPTPSLNEKNPAAELAEDYAEQAELTARQLQERADELAKNVDFGDQLTPTKDRLGYAANEQQQIQEDVQATSQDLARASRHERRLEKAVAAAALQKAAEDVKQIADGEVQQARQQLQTAQENAPDPQVATKAEGAAEQGDGNKTKGDNSPALAANAAVAKSEAALAAQADALEPQTSSESAEASDGGGETQQPALTAENMAAGRELAQTLDELDRQVNGEPQTPGSDPSSNVPTLAQAAKAQQAQQASARSLAQQQAAFSQNTHGPQSDSIPAYDGATGEFVVVPVNRNENADWGKLREQSAEDLTRGRREQVSEEYRRSVETYFRVLAERAGRKQP
ncbi:MAG: hypothetical protein R3C59_17855 [Planctomycetaceae bacterium]